MKIWNFQKYNLAIDHLPDFGYPRTPQEAITMINEGQTIVVIASAQELLANLFSVLDIKIYSKYDNGTAIFYPL